jgi:predicted secreted hydrolase
LDAFNDDARAPVVNLVRRRMVAFALASTATSARANVTYPQVQPGTALVFPADDGAHPAFRTEWWYVTGWLRDAQAHELGFQVTFFRIRPGIAETSTSRFAPKQLLFAHAALANPEWARLRYDQRAAREGFGLAAAATGTTDVIIGDWSLMQQADRFAAHVRARAFAMELTLDASAPPLLQGERGVSRKGPDPADASYYYSRPQLAVEGSVAFDEKTREVSGVAWLDHEWSSRLMPQGGVGWDWIGINFDDGSALMAFRIRDANGGALWAGGAYRDRQDVSRALVPGDVDFIAQRSWRSPRTAIAYPVSFRVRAGDIDVTLEPLLDDQELDARAGVGTVYWEGAMRASIRGRVAGRGYLELTGYGEPLRI